MFSNPKHSTSGTTACDNAHQRLQFVQGSWTMSQIVLTAQGPRERREHQLTCSLVGRGLSFRKMRSIPSTFFLLPRLLLMAASSLRRLPFTICPVTGWINPACRMPDKSMPREPWRVLTVPSLERSFLGIHQRLWTGPQLRRASHSAQWEDEHGLLPTAPSSSAWRLSPAQIHIAACASAHLLQRQGSGSLPVWIRGTEQVIAAGAVPRTPAVQTNAQS